MNFNKIKLTNISCLFFLSVVLGCGGESDGEGSDSGISSSEVLTKINSYQLTTDLEESIHQLRSLETKCMLHMALFQSFSRVPWACPWVNAAGDILVYL